MKKIIKPGSTTFHCTCSECAAHFTYERSDVRQNYVRGGEWVSCPQCGHECRHFGNGGWGSAHNKPSWSVERLGCLDYWYGPVDVTR
jgi:NAD-dependent SIR2 family protein deacetylase